MAMHRRAFTLIELLIVLGIIALLMAILVPSMNSAARASRVRETQARIHALAKAIRDYHRVYGAYPPCASPDRSILRTGDSYAMYHYPVEYQHSDASLGMTTEAENIFNPTNDPSGSWKGSLVYGGKFLAYFLMGPRGDGWQRPRSPTASDPNYANRGITATWDAPEGIRDFFENRPVIEGAPKADNQRFPLFADAFGISGYNGGTIAYVAAAPLSTATDASRFPTGWNNGPLSSAFYWDCRSHPSYPGDGRAEEQQKKILDQCPYDFAVFSPGPDKKFGYRVTIMNHNGTWMRGSWSDLDKGLIDDIANFPLH